MQWPSAAGWPGARAAAVLVLAASVLAPSAAAPGASLTAEPFDAPLARAPLDPPLVLNGGFGEFRSNHFHAGLDLGTGGRVGRPVYAPLNGWIGRVRASGVGYGRSIYLNTDDGRLLVFAHLDAYAAPLAAFVAAAQESSGQYEQDLWPAAGRFRVRAGQRIAWTGESGAGGPHLHFEIRRGDMAYNPLRAGLAIPDTSAPTLVNVTLEPLDDASYVERSAGPVTVRLREPADTVSVIGRVRVVVAARDGVWRGVDRMVPWSLGMSFDRTEVECRFDSVSWATDMAESDHVYDAGRVVGEKGFVMWAPPGFRPQVLRIGAAERLGAGALSVRPGDPPRTLWLVARDVAGRTRERSLVLRPPAAGQGAPDSAQAGGGAEPDSARWFELAALPDGHLRMSFRGAPVGSRGVTIGGRPASLRAGEWTAVVALPRGGAAGPQPFRLPIAGVDAGGRRWSREFSATLSADPVAASPRSDRMPFAWTLPRGARFEPAPVLSRWSQAPPAAPAELAARSPMLELMPANLPLREPVRIELARDAGGSRLGLYTDDGSGWSWLRAPLDSATGRRVGETRHLGRFALFADTLAPRVRPLAPPARVTPGPYSRWALEARVVEEGSGVDARASWFEVAGRRVPAEWDPEKNVLRWRPRRAPAAGSHRFSVVVTDRAGNLRRVAGRFTVKSDGTPKRGGSDVLD